MITLCHIYGERQALAVKRTYTALTVPCSLRKTKSGYLIRTRCRRETVGKKIRQHQAVA